MNCQFFQLHYDNLLDGLLDEPEQTAMESHLAACADCRAWINWQQNLTDSLRQLPIPPARAGFAEAALRRAREVHEMNPVHIVRPTRRRLPLWFASGLAAVSATVLVLLGVGWLPQSTPSGVAAVRFAVNQTRSVRLAFNSPEELRDVTLSLELPANFEFADRPGDRSLLWRTTLRKGGNVLTVPIVAVRRGDGNLVAKLIFDRKQKSFRVLLNADTATTRSERSHTITPV